LPRSTPSAKSWVLKATIRCTRSPRSTDAVSDTVAPMDSPASVRSERPRSSTTLTTAARNAGSS
jgi:hypothetical protein